MEHNIRSLTSIQDHIYLLCDMHAQNVLHECNYASDDQGPPIYETRLFALCLYPIFTVGYLDKQKGMRVCEPPITRSFRYEMMG